MKRQRPRVRSRLCGDLVRTALFLVFFIALSLPTHAQDASQGPLAPPPEHRVSRSIGTQPEPEAPPALPPDEIVRRFSQKEDEYLVARSRHTSRKSIRLQEFGPDGKLSGEFLRVTETSPGADGRPVVKVIEKPQSTLQHAFLAPEDLEALDRVPVYPLTSSQLPKYNLKYLGKEQVDEIDCYIFQVKPKMLERTHGLFHGVIWVDAKYLEVVKTYGKWVMEQGDAPILTQYPFALFETYRENVGGKYWFPNYSRSDDTLHLKDQDVSIRLVIKWSDFKPLPSVAPAPATAPASAAKP
ncbi:MAG TPA: hypothetical protein VG051_06400 [Candidatus Acidoferrum sp.]|jgi:hypothetical protein|nr:hypothetical protein [Candidatus Acidoferrum sp.]